MEARADPIGFSLPTSVTVRVTRGAHVAVFEVRPGNGSVLRYPRSRDQETRLDAGVHRVPLDAGRRPGDAFERLRGFSRLPGLGRVPSLDPPGLGRPYLLVVASRDPMWLSGHYLGQVFRPRDVRLSLPLLVDAVLRDVLPHPRLGAWAFDLRPGVPRLRIRPLRRYDRPPGRRPGRPRFP